MVEAVRAGMSFAYDPKAYQRWRTDVNRRLRITSGKGLRDLLTEIGGNVERGNFEFRN